MGIFEVDNNLLDLHAPYLTMIIHNIRREMQKIGSNKTLFTAIRDERAAAADVHSL